jgi:NAD(P)-dependent dehydrogenase (short-subunit alcohol dehydrogenase family)
VRFDGRAVVITGGASGFGRATAERFAAEGAIVTILDVAANGVEVASEITASSARAGGGKPVAFAATDVTDEQQVVDAIGAAFDRSGRLDVVVNNAGVLGGGWMHEDGATAHLRRQLDVNVLGVWHGCRAALEIMRANGGGVIVNTASPAGQVPTPGAVQYGLCKSAVLHLTQSLAIGYAPDNVRVNAVLPGPAITGIYGIDESKRADLERAYLANIPLGRLAQVDDIAHAIAYLASDEAGFVTGALLNVDGGFRPRLPPRVLSS